MVAWLQAHPRPGIYLRQVDLPGVQTFVQFFAAVLGGLIVRKPGAAIYTELIAATVSALIGSQWGFGTLMSGLVQGLGAELVFALFLYANWNVFTAVLAGAGAGVARSG